MSDAMSVTMAANPAQSLRDQCRYLDDEQWACLVKIEALNGVENVHELLLKDPEVVVSQIGRFRDYEAAIEKHVLDVVTSKVEAANLSARPSGATTTYLPPPAPPSPSVGLKPVHVSVSSYSGDDNENLVFWVRENEIAMAAARITDERQKIAFGISNMKGRAKTWALTCETTHPGCFTSWDIMVQAIKEVFLPPNVAHRQRAAFLACVQGNRELHVFVQELRQLMASMAANAIPQDVMVTTFVEHLNPGPVKAAVFREECKTLDEAILIALREDYVQRSATGQPANPVAANNSHPEVQVASRAKPVDLSTVDLSGLSGIDLSEMDLTVVDLSALDVNCFTCGKLGHYQRDCPRSRGRRAKYQPRRSRDRGRGLGYGTVHSRFSTGHADRTSQGNAGSQ